MSVTRILAGLSNQLYILNSPKVLIRKFGANGDLLINRVKERQVLEMLADTNIGPKTYFHFQDGRIEEYLDADVVSNNIYSSVQKQIVVRMKRMHKFRNSQEIPMVIDNINKWTDIAKKLNNDFSKYYDQKDLLIDEIKKVVTDDDIVLCHNDLHLKNILITKDNEIKLIDFEYSGYNYYYYDIANHLLELTMECNDDSYVFNSLPPETITNFCKLYAGGVKKGKVLEKKLPIFIKACHYLWGLWGIIKAHGNNNDKFPYLNYGRDRLILFES